MIAKPADAVQTVRAFGCVTGLAGSANCAQPRRRRAGCEVASGEPPIACMGGPGVSVLLASTSLCASRHARRLARTLAGKGIRCVISSRLEEPFATHCVALGILPIAVADTPLRTLLSDAGEAATSLMTVDLERQEIVRANGMAVPFQVDAMIRRRLQSPRTPVHEHVP